MTASFIRYEGQVGVGIALRKEVLRRRGAILTRAELSAILERAGIL
jgi:hypothetical protein